MRCAISPAPTLVSLVLDFALIVDVSEEGVVGKVVLQR